MRAYEQLKSEGIRVRVIDAYSVKPIDKVVLHQAAQVTGGRLVVVEDHWFEGGIGDAVLNAFVGVGEKLPRWSNWRCVPYRPPVRPPNS